MRATKSLCGITLALTFGLVTTLKAQYIFVAGPDGIIGKYWLDGTSNNAPLISGLNEPEGLAVSGTNLFVANYGSDTVGEYSIFGTTNSVSLITGLNGPKGIAISGNDLYVVNSDSGTIGEYTISGASVSTDLISGLESPSAIAISGTNLFVENSGNGNIGEYTTSGTTINTNLISKAGSKAIIISGTNLFVLNGETISEYTTSGTTINANLITLSGNPNASGMAMSGNDLFVAQTLIDNVGEYTTYGATVNANLIPWTGEAGQGGGGITSPTAIAVIPVPNLNIVTVGNQSVLFYPVGWAGNSGFVLQTITNVASTNWLSVSNGVPIMGVTVPNNLPASFFRLVPAN